MRYIIFILSLLMVGCVGYKDYEEAAVKQAKEETKCKRTSIAMSNSSNDERYYIIKVRACDEYITYHCVSSDGCKSFSSIKCQRIAVESKPTEDAGELK